MYVFRIHIRPQGGSANMRATFDYCLREGILGVGWRTPTNRNTTNWDEYYSEASQVHDKLQVCKYIRKWVSPGDLVWTRDPSGNYYLGRVTSGWEYWTTEESRRIDIDIANIFRCELEHVSIDVVPGKIIACFRATRSIQEIADHKAYEYTRYLWNKLKGLEIYKIDKTKFSDIFMMLDDEETEDLLFLYLQTKGWYVVPHSRKGDTMTFEYLCVNPLNGQLAGTQVKTGKAALNKDAYAKFGHKVFLFQANDIYTGVGSDNVELIPRSELMEFISKAALWLPKSLRLKFDLVTNAPHLERQSYPRSVYDDKKEALLHKVFSNSMFACFVYENTYLVRAGRALADGADCSYICDIAVIHSHQGTGLGKQIVSYLVERSRGHKKMEKSPTMLGIPSGT